MISVKWTIEERLKICEQIAAEMLKRRNTKNWVSIEDAMQWADRILFVSCMPAEFLEANRVQVLNGILPK